jgi:hypothetical protein
MTDVMLTDSPLCRAVLARAGVGLPGALTGSLRLRTAQFVVALAEKKKMQSRTVLQSTQLFSCADPS